MWHCDARGADITVAAATITILTVAAGPGRTTYAVTCPRCGQVTVKDATGRVARRLTAAGATAGTLDAYPTEPAPDPAAGPITAPEVAAFARRLGAEPASPGPDRGRVRRRRWWRR